MNTLTITLESGQEIGYICWYVIDLCVTLNVLHVHDVFQRQGYGTLLIQSMLNTLDVPLYITVDDCSDLSGTSESIYYKFGFRLIDDKMTVHTDFINHIDLKNITSKSVYINHES